MTHLRRSLLLLLVLPCSLLILAAQPAADEALTLRSLGAVGDGQTDDRAAIEAALATAAGATLDGEGLTYAVHGNIAANTDVDFRNATLVQTMGSVDMAKYFPSVNGVGALSVEPPEAYRRTVKGLPYLRADGIGVYSEDPVLNEEDLKAALPSIVLRTLVIRGSDDRPVAVRLENIKIDRGNHPDTGGRNDGAGLRIEHASPVNVNNLEITGDGKGIGLIVAYCSDVKIERLNIHDMNWAPYAGDNIFEILPVQSIRDDFGWNNFPIYEYRVDQRRFVRVRIQEQLVGLFVISCNNVEILDSKIERIQTRIGDELYPLQTDGMTINRTVNVTVRDCDVTKTWEAIDFTGASGSDFVFENCYAADTIGWGIKLAHPKQNGKIVNCRTERAGIAGFVIGTDSENIELIDCQALETGANNYWTRPDGSHVMTLSGIYIESSRGKSTPLDITIKGCSVVNKEHPGAIDFGILCEADLEGRNIKLIDSTAVGARVQAIKGFSPGG